MVRALATAAVLTLLASGAALAEPADLDPTFSGDGKVLTPYEPDPASPSALVVQPDGKIVVVGGVGNTSGRSARTTAELIDFLFTRYLPNGKLDRTFGGDGSVRIHVGSGDNEGSAIALQPDGRIVAAGYALTGGGTRIAVVRLLQNGRLDRSFGGDGKVVTPFFAHAFAYDVAVQPDGKIVVAGDAGDAGRDFAVLRYRPNGALDRSFGPDDDGKVTSEFGSAPSSIADVAIRPNGKILAVGRALPAGNVIALAQYTRAGAPDPQFGQDGRLTTALGDHSAGRALALQPDGRAVVAAYREVGSNYDFALLRYLASGTLDGTFGTDGRVITPVGAGDDLAEAVALQPNGRIVVSGSSEKTPSTRNLAFTRHGTDGRLDPSFSEDGKLEVDLGLVYTSSVALGLQRNGRIVSANFHPGGLSLVALLAEYPRVSVGDARRQEGDSGTSAVRVPVRLTVPPGSSPVTVRYETAELSAASPGDFRDRSGLLTFSGRRTVRWISVPIVGDRRGEGNESFRVALALPGNATLTDAWATVTIRDDD